MKPMVIKVENGRVDITYEEFKKYVDEVYKEGYEDGKKSIPSYTVNSYPFSGISTYACADSCDDGK